MKCPNCGGEIKRFELAPNCRHCGVNIFYCQQEKLLSTDAKRCELEYASLRIFTAKLKSAFIKGALPVSRLVFSVLTLCSLLIPFASIQTDIPVISKKISFGGIGLYSSFSDGTLEALLNMAKEGTSPQLTKSAAILLFAIILIALCVIVILLTEILSFINIRKSALIMRYSAIAGTVFSIFAVFASFNISNSVTGESFCIASADAGSFVILFMFIADFVINHLFIIKNISPEIKEVDIERVKIRKKIKTGELTYEELPLPVLESEEERIKRIEKEQKSKTLSDEAKGGEKNV